MRRCRVSGVTVGLVLVGLVLAGLVLVASVVVDAAVPDLKPGVKLTLGGARAAGWASPEVVDWNNDGLNDLLVGHASGSLRLYLNHGMSQQGIRFERAPIVRQDKFENGGAAVWAWRFNKANCVCPGPGRISPRVVDWNHDGAKDLLIGDGQGAQTRIWRNIGTDDQPIFSTHHLEYLPRDGGIRPYHETVQPCLGDWNGDGKVDLIMGRNRGIYIYENVGTTTEPVFDFTSRRLGVKVRGIFPTERLSPVVIDWDQDGKQDLLVGSQTGAVWFARNVGSATDQEFAGYTPLRSGGSDIRVRGEARLAAADLDGDGEVDLLVGDELGQVWFFRARCDRPIARSRHVTVQVARPTPVRLFGTHDAGTDVSFEVASKPEHGQLKGTAPELTYVPDAGFVGDDNFTFRVTAGESVSESAVVRLDVREAPGPPTITVQPADTLTAVGETAVLSVVAKGTPPLKYQWHRDGEVIQRATGSAYLIRKAALDDSGPLTVTVSNAAGSVTSRVAKLAVEAIPDRTVSLPVVDIRFTSPTIEPATAGVLTITRRGNVETPVDVRLRTKPHHHPVVTDIHFVPIPETITLAADQTAAEVRVMPIDDTVVNGNQASTFEIVPHPTYRLGSKLASARMMFLDDDCPDVTVTASDHAFTVTAQPAPARDTTVSYTVSGTAVAGVDYAPLPGKVTIPAGETAATIEVPPYRHADDVSGNAAKKTLDLTLPTRAFTYFDFYDYLTKPGKRQATVQLVATSDSPQRPAGVGSIAKEDAEVVQLRQEVAKLGWLVFAAPAASGNRNDLDLFAMRPDGSARRNLTNTPDFDEYSARVSPNGRRMLYRRTTKLKRAFTPKPVPQDVGGFALKSRPPHGTLIIANIDGSESRAVGGDGELAWASWGPDGQQLACLETQPVETSQGTAQAKSAKPVRRIVIRDATSLEVMQTLPAAGIESHLVWSPDGQRVCGAANLQPGKRQPKGYEYTLGIGKLASVDLKTGRRTAMARFPDWTPVWATDSDGDWFQGGSSRVLHSANNYGICPAYHAALWSSGLDGQPSQLVYAQYGKHAFGGCTSPDDRYAVFVIGSENWPVAGEMAIVPLSDGPIARGDSPLFHAVLDDHFPGIKQGPVLDLPNLPLAFDPHWTMADFGRGEGR